MSSRLQFELNIFSTYSDVEFSGKLANTSMVMQVSGGITILTLDRTFWSEVQNLVLHLIR